MKASRIGVVLSGIDTLHLFTSRPLEAELLRELLALKATAASLSPGVPLPSISIGGQTLQAQPRGNKKGPILLKNENLDLTMNPSAPANMPTGFVELRSLFLWQRGAASAVRVADDILQAVVAVEDPSTQVSRADLSADFQGWIPQQSDLSRLVTRAHADSSFRSRKTFTGFSFGRGEVVARLYDKTAELKLTSKAWFFDLWGLSPEFKPELPVWRLEFQIRREGLRAFGIANRQGDLGTWEVLQVSLSALFERLRTRWLALLDRRTATWRISPDA